LSGVGVDPYRPSAGGLLSGKLAISPEYLRELGRRRGSSSAVGLLVLVTLLLIGLLSANEIEMYWPLGLLVVGLALTRWRRSGDPEPGKYWAEEVFEDPREVQLKLLEIEVDSGHSAYEFQVVGGEQLFVHTVEPGGIGPLFVDADRQFALALRHRDSVDYYEFLVLSEDLREFADPEFSVEQLRARFAERDRV
jgi:hypothetical protein